MVERLDVQPVRRLTWRIYSADVRKILSPIRAFSQASPKPMSSSQHERSIARNNSIVIRWLSVETQVGNRIYRISYSNSSGNYYYILLAINQLLLPAINQLSDQIIIIFSNYCNIFCYVLNNIGESRVKPSTIDFL